MATKDYYGVVEAVRYLPDGIVSLVRVYQRIGSAFSDRRLLTRDEFVRQLKAGKRYVSGKRIANMGGSFETGDPVRLMSVDGQDFLTTEGSKDGRDCLGGVPRF